MRPCAAEKILIGATALALVQASKQREHPEHAGATRILENTTSVDKTRYRSGTAFPDPDWISACEQQAPMCARYVRYELRQAMDPRVKEHTHCRKAILIKWLGEDEVSRFWPRIPAIVPVGDDLRLRIDDAIDLLALEIMNLRAMPDQDVPHRCAQCQMVREQAHDIALEDRVFSSVLLKLWNELVRLMPTKEELQPWIREGEYRPWQRLTKVEVEELHDLHPASGTSVYTAALRTMRCAKK